MAIETANPFSGRLKIFLVGFMASGKSTVGRALAARLECEFIDLDDWIVAQAGCTIAELIERQGEDQFRQLETACLRRAARLESAVIAPGGGAITRAENLQLMQHSGTLVWLDAPFELCWQRIRQDQTVRPLAPDEATARARYKARLPLYERATVRLSVSAELTAHEIAAAAYRQLSSAS